MMNGHAVVLLFTGSWTSSLGVPGISTHTVIVLYRLLPEVSLTPLLASAKV